jgi:hypothetical protein
VGFPCALFPHAHVWRFQISFILLPAEVNWLISSCKAANLRRRRFHNCALLRKYGKCTFSFSIGQSVGTIFSSAEISRTASSFRILNLCSIYHFLPEMTTQFLRSPQINLSAQYF